MPLYALATCALWLVARPGTSRWKLAGASALASAGLALAANQAISHLWIRERPFAAHPGDAFLAVAPSTDPSFPSDHAAAAFAIAVAVYVFSRRVGAVFLAAAALIALSRVLAGVHYPGDVVAGALVGAGAALVVTRLARRPLEVSVAAVSRVSDPVVARLRR